MTTDVLRFEIGTATEFVAPNGKRYLRGNFEGLCFTAYPDPEREPAEGGVARWVVMASPAPGKARHVRVPAIPLPPVVETVARPSAAQRLRDAATDAIARYRAIPPGGDRLDDILAAEPYDECESDIPLMERPLI
ncbi:MAG: hypothetical protein J0I42_23565 [Bosea sp.]|uniref:hypothetical protein n=1 Tax=Bosea sp. (in: a-proteobacteria) TaxID=1871050 RepID=UPI001AD0287F|nr:hypothetical protein [Bosea sp. (in: a-proteobacteria)]MBN9454931.1 hypothetical protein [Bosea sp. (in: a-proteobacteria)]